MQKAHAKNNFTIVITISSYKTSSFYTVTSLLPYRKSANPSFCYRIWIMVTFDMIQSSDMIFILVVIKEWTYFFSCYRRCWRIRCEHAREHTHKFKHADVLRVAFLKVQGNGLQILITSPATYKHRFSRLSRETAFPLRANTALITALPSRSPVATVRLQQYDRVKLTCLRYRSCIKCSPHLTNILWTAL